MATERVVPLYEEQSNNKVLNSINEERQYWQQPLPTYIFNLDLSPLRHSDESPLPCRETVNEFESVISAFSEGINNLFDALAICQGRDVEAIHKLTPYFNHDRLLLIIRVMRQLIDRSLSCRHRDYHSKRLVLQDPNALPQVSCVTKLRIFSGRNHGADDDVTDVRPVSLRVPLQLLTHLPAVQELECPWGWEYLPIAYPSEPMRHYSRPWEGPWRDARHDFGRAVQELHEKIPASLRRARFWLYHPCTSDDDQSMPLPNLVHPADVDPLSVGLRLFTSHLEELDLRAILTPAIFDAQEISWPRMKRLRVEFHPMRSDGSWYFIGPRGEDPHPKGFSIQDNLHYPPVTTTDEDERIDAKHNDYTEEYYDDDERRPDMFRTEPSVDRIEPLLTTFAQRLKATPTLEEAELSTYLSWFPSEDRQARYEEIEETSPYEEGVHRWGVKYVAAKGGEKASVEWQVGEWRPGDDVLELFEGLGENGEVDMVWKGFEFSESMYHDGGEAFWS